MGLNAGRLRHRVQIQQSVPVIDSNGDAEQNQETGEVVLYWQEVAEVWAAIEPISGREFIQSAAIQSKITARIIIRYRSDINAAMRAIHNGKIYNIEAVLPDPDSGLEWLTLPCSEGVNNG